MDGTLRVRAKAAIEKGWKFHVRPAVAFGLSQAGSAIDLVYQARWVSEGLHELGWPPIHYSNLELHGRLARLLRKPISDDDRAIAVQLILDHYQEEGLDTMWLHWQENPQLKDRLPALEQAVDAHRRGHHYASLPLLYAQTDGVLRAMLAAGRTDRHFSTASYLRLISTLHFKVPGWAALQAFIDKEAWSQYILHEQDQAANSRHGVLHGLSTDYGTAEFSTKGLLLFDFVQDCLQTATIEQRGVLHRAGCHLLKDPAANLVFYQNAAWAMLAGRVTHHAQCPSCLADWDGPLLSPRTTRLIEQRMTQAKTAWVETRRAQAALQVPAANAVEDES